LLQENENLKEDVLDLTLWGNGCERGFGSAVKTDYVMMMMTMMMGTYVCACPGKYFMFLEQLVQPTYSTD